MRPIGAFQDALVALPFARPIAFAPLQRKAPVVAAALQAMDLSYPINLDELVELSREFEVESRLGSTDTINEEEMKMLKKMVRDFQRQFGIFIKMKLPSLLRP